MRLSGNLIDAEVDEGRELYGCFAQRAFHFQDPWRFDTGDGAFSFRGIEEAEVNVWGKGDGFCADTGGSGCGGSERMSGERTVEGLECWEEEVREGREGSRGAKELCGFYGHRGLSMEGIECLVRCGGLSAKDLEIIKILDLIRKPLT